jgi:hypothetical protein
MSAGRIAMPLFARCAATVRLCCCSPVLLCYWWWWWCLQMSFFAPGPLHVCRLFCFDYLCWLPNNHRMGGLKDNSDPQFCKEPAHEARNARSLSHVACCCNSSRVKNSRPCQCEFWLLQTKLHAVVKKTIQSVRWSNQEPKRKYTCTCSHHLARHQYMHTCSHQWRQQPQRRVDDAAMSRVHGDMVVYNKHNCTR